MRNIFKIVKETIGKMSGSDKKKNDSRKKSGDESWEKRRAELLDKTRNKENNNRHPRGQGQRRGNNRRNGQKGKKNVQGEEKGRNETEKDSPQRNGGDNRRNRNSNRYKSGRPGSRTKSAGDKREQNGKSDYAKKEGGERRKRNQNSGNRRRNEGKTDPKTPRPPKSETTEKKPETKPAEKPKIIEKWDPAVFKVEPMEGKARFHDLNLQDELMRAVYDLGFKYCTPIQSEILKSTISGSDAMGKAQTGTGKTAAFLISIFSRLLKNPAPDQRRNATPRALILAPTRELVMQIAKDAAALSKYTGIHTISIFGGMDYRKQRRLLAGKPVDVVVATPGRLLDFYKKREIHLSRVEILVIDEADRMLDMGFIPDVKKIIHSTPRKDKRQTLLFSATLTTDIRMLASSWTREAVHVEIDPENVAVDTVDQKVYIVTADEKYTVLYNLIKKKNLQRVIVFANRRDETRDLEQRLKKDNFSCAVLSGDVDQRIRIRTLDSFKEGKIDVLVATDVAGRGIHIDGVSHVVNFTLPEDPEDYVHRIGRTGRAGATGTSVSFASEDDSFQIPAIEEYIGRKLECIYPDEEMLEPIRNAEKNN